MSSLRRSLAFSFGQTYGSYLLGLVGIVVLSRLLTPAEFGVFSVGASIVMLVNAVRDFGIGTFLVQEPELTPAHLRSAVTIAFGISVSCALGLSAAAVPIAGFYGEARVADIVLVLAAGMVVSVVGIPGLSLLRRDLQFDALAAINLSASVVQLGVVVALALLGHGAMSLAWATLAESLFRTTAAILCRPVPGAFRPSLTAWRSVLAFGGYSTATAIINVFHDTLPKLIIGRLLGVVPVGLYGRATMVCALPDRMFVSALQPVMLPAMAEQARAGRDLRGPYLLALTHMSALLWPGLLCLILLADPIVRLMLGPQWGEVPPLVRIMALGSLSLFPAFMTFPTMVALGRIRDTLWMSAISVPPSILVILALSHVSLEAVAAAQIVNAPLQVVVAIVFIRRRLPIAWSDILRAIRPSAIVAVCAAAMPALMIALGGFRLDLSTPAFVLAILGAAAGWLAGLALSGHPMMTEVRQVARMLGRTARQGG
ncbi:lipopolysaccharide biosynthesis protein [Roseomonas terrae]|uniref:Lipopolysaccharide biosynthesis protein n=1 Tax=Neoroseomonas terrae TaxID=424799 RepID=A0ABS5EJ33_9PROT|nr:lipopolysaccharide biosynthesis protein [Neoroseomonas terrae]MBR0651036.1 lipopolysaccharide biosynthesis protein [Neoroseomonas terrae]